eukprot:TRINITY_DN208_c1_g1_i1.p1 TRINITY_DN208_c1_g1~~TRINITY_DN208_c1_g1_i1.p1  ORF type:complete len:470 (+),score=95.04 TRINITY_DN208_c1_g1_i1:51-1412(+)
MAAIPALCAGSARILCKATARSALRASHARSWFPGSLSGTAGFGTWLRDNRATLGISLENTEKLQRRQPDRAFDGEDRAPPSALAKREIREAASRRDWQAARARFLEGPPAPVTFAAIMYAADRCGKLEEGEEFYAQMRQAGFARADAFTSLINLNCRYGNMTRARELLAEMRACNLVVDAMVFSALLNGAAKLADAECAQSIWQEMLSVGIKPTLIGFVSLMNAYAEAGRVDLAIASLDQILQHGLQPQAVHWNIVLKACKMKPDAATARREFQRMRAAGFEPIIVTYTALLGAIWRSAEPGWEAEVETLLSDMSKAGVPHDLRFVEERIASRLGCYASEALTRTASELDAGRLEEAAAYFRAFETSSPENLPRRAELVRRDLEQLLQRVGSLGASRTQDASAAPGDSSASTSDWVEVQSAAHGNYFWNRISGATQWERPAGVLNLAAMQAP